MYREAYDLIIEILNDAQLNEYVQKVTNKKLAIIDSGAQLTTPSAAISFEGGAISRGENAMQNVDYTITFSLPFWSANSFRNCHDFLDNVIAAFFAHEQRTHSLRRNYITKISPSITEEDTEKKLWTVSLRVTVSIYL